MIGENDPDMPEFKFIYYNGKTRQNTYEGAFVYSRARTLEPESMAKVYSIAKEAGMNPDQFCRIRNGCFANQGAAANPDPLFAAPSNKGTPAVAPGAPSPPREAKRRSPGSAPPAGALLR